MPSRRECTGRHGSDTHVAGMRLHTPAEHVRARRFYEREGWTASSGPFYEPMLGLTLVTYRIRM